MSELSNRLRRASVVCEDWALPIQPPLKDWAALMDEAAEALESFEEDDDEEVDEPDWDSGA